ncbi:oxygen-independent coproporphyrinogen III oxidase [Atopobacter sp. AH10]|uniref:radical SAM family heme chaperone HemW n=1 Tax=Atopobacter sp. AH10 TaxID=2315861 RepID=UPI000EF1BE33|nr:radical SAM family heme chaperone HemW [Atopobacter sp. AH10]RLK63407.1 oxygen-independent coproporphyrinogen III oxidase [Atopobacter sp. AH10]
MFLADHRLDQLLRQEAHGKVKRLPAAYIHIPFCEHICYYCDFNKVFLEGQPVDDYVDALVKEMRLYQENGQKISVSSLYIGGGTPSVLSLQQFERLMEGIRDIFSLKDNGEFTVEMNPNNVTDDLLSLLMDAGVNRFSLGVQSFDDQLLKRIGRAHTSQEAIRAVKLLQKKGAENISIDLMFALPQQDLRQVKDSVQIGLDLDIPHFSAYSLILEKKTVFYNLQRLGKLPLPSEDLEVEMFSYIMEEMEKAGRHHYEISNYSRPGFESQHNLSYWDRRDYYGFGAGAHGLLNHHRYHNHGPIQHYLAPLKENKKPVIHEKALTIEEEMEEYFFLGLRRMSGVSLTDFQQQFGYAVEEIYPGVVKKLVDSGLLAVEGERIFLSQEGIFLGNNVFAQFLREHANSSE